MVRHQAASARGRKQTAPRMERRVRIAANPTNSLLSRQFANITDVLVKASQRRNAELQELEQRRLRSVTTPSTSKSTTKLPDTTQANQSQGSDSADDRVGLKKVYKSNTSTANDELTVAADTTRPPDMQKTQVHLRGGYVSDYAADPKMMLVEPNSSQQQRSDNGTKKELDNDHNLSHMLADAKKAPSSSKGTAALRENDSKVMLADVKVDAEDQLSALAERLGIKYDVEAMLDDFDEEKEAAGTDESDDEDDDLETLRGKMAAIFSLASDIASKGSLQTIKNMSVVGNTSTSQQDEAGILESDGIPYPEIDELEAKKERDEMVKRENEKLDATIKYVLKEEERYQAIEEKKSLPSRLIVTNLAADIDEEAIRIFFVKYKWEIRNITILPGREPVKRTRTAYIDMYTKEMAVRASYEFGGIYGLIAKIKLAAE